MNLSISGVYLVCKGIWSFLCTRSGLGREAFLAFSWRECSLLSLSTVLYPKGFPVHQQNHLSFILFSDLHFLFFLSRLVIINWYQRTTGLIMAPLNPAQSHVTGETQIEGMETRFKEIQRELLHNLTGRNEDRQPLYNPKSSVQLPSNQKITPPTASTSTPHPNPAPQNRGG